MNDLIKRLEKLLVEIQNLKSKVNLDAKQQKILELEDAMQASGFWDDNETAQKITQEHNQLILFTSFWHNLETNVIENLALITQNTDESDETLKYLENLEVCQLKKFKENGEIRS